MIFIDFQKDYDTVPQKLPYQALKNVGINESLINVIKLLYKDIICKVKMGKKTIRGTSNKQRTFQECHMTPTLLIFRCVLKKWVLQCGKMGIKIGNKHLIHLLFSDDQIMAQTKEDLKYVTEKALKAYNQWA